MTPASAAPTNPYMAEAYADVAMPPGTSLRVTADVEAAMGSTAAQRSADALIAENAKLAKANFGSSADNATAVVAFLWR